MKHINKYTSDIELQDSFSRAGDFLVYSTTGIASFSIIGITHGVKTLDADRLISDVVLENLPVAMHMGEIVDINWNTGEPCNYTPKILGNVFIGLNWTAYATVYEYSDNMISDVLGSVFASAMNDDLQSANAYLRTAQMLLSLVKDKRADLPMPSRYTSSSKLFKI